MRSLPHISTDQVAALVELARQGELRIAAGHLGITEQGLRNRLVALEAQLGVELYRKVRGRRRDSVLTTQGQRFLPHALAFLDRAHALCQASGLSVERQEVRIVASQYLTRYLLIDALKHFRSVAPDVHVRISTMTEADLTEVLLSDPDVEFGLAAPYESSPRLEYVDLFPLDWRLITPVGHTLAAQSTVSLTAIAAHECILFEQGSSGRQHVLEAFNRLNLSPQVTLETASTDTVVSMVEAGLGVAIVPLMPNGAVTHRRAVEVRSIAETIRPIHSGVLRRRAESLSPAATRLLTFVQTHNVESTSAPGSRD